MTMHKKYKQNANAQQSYKPGLWEMSVAASHGLPQEEHVPLKHMIIDHKNENLNYNKATK